MTKAGFERAVEWICLHERSGCWMNQLHRGRLADVHALTLCRTFPMAQPDCGGEWEGAEVDEDRLASAQGGAKTAGNIEVTYVVVWSELYATPVMFFTASATGTEPGRRPSVAELKRFAMPRIVDALGVSHEELIAGQCSVLVSEGFCEELQQAMFSVHPCDVKTMLLHAVEAMGPPKNEDVGGPDSVLTRFIRMCGPLVGIPPLVWMDSDA